MTQKTVSETGTRESRALALTQQIVNAAADAKGRDITVLDVSKVFGLTDYFIVVSGRSDRQVQGISHKIIDTLGEQGIRPYSREGIDEGQWVLLDFGDAIVHVFYEPAREHYDIEGLWTKARRLSVVESETGHNLELRAQAA